MNLWQPAPQRVNLGRQLARLRAGSPAGQGEVRRASLAWQEWVSPSPLGRDYLVRVCYALGHPPATYVPTPSLADLAEGRPLPHVYSQETSQLCLYLPGCGQWHSSRFLADTIIPWAILWLYFFEEWLVSDEWKGGGEHPRPRRSRKKIR